MNKVRILTTRLNESMLTYFNENFPECDNKAIRRMDDTLFLLMEKSINGTIGECASLVRTRLESIQ